MMLMEEPDSHPQERLAITLGSIVIGGLVGGLIGGAIGESRLGVVVGGK